MTYLILLAGGIGSRVGSDIPKQFIEVLGKPVIAYTMERFQQHKEIDAIELVCVDGFQESLRKMAESQGITKVVNIVTGGKDYEHSIINGVEGLKGMAKPNDVVMIHWAAAPFVSDDLISDSIRVCKEKGNAICACPAYLLYGANNGDHADSIINRDSFRVLTAPHSFLYKNIVRMYEMVEEQHLFDRVEAHTTTLMAELGIPIYFSKGNQTNIKITTKEDLELFEGYVLAQRQREGHCCKPTNQQA